MGTARFQYLTVEFLFDYAKLESKALHYWANFAIPLLLRSRQGREANLLKLID